MTWTHVGPLNIGGCMLGITVDPRAGNRLLAVSASGGCWRLEYDIDALLPFVTVVRTRWTALTDDQPLLYTTAMALCRQHPETIYYATGHYNRSWPAQLWRSDNDGRSWSQPAARDFGLVYRIVIDPDDPGRVYVASINGLWGSVDRGTSWDALYSGVAYDVAIDPDDPSILYAGIDGVGLIKTTNARPRRRKDSLIFWRTILPWSLLPRGNMIRIALGGRGSPSRRLVALKFDIEVWTNANSGEDVVEWQSRGSPGRSKNNYGQGNWDHVIAVDPFNDDIILAGAQDLYRTEGGSEWIQVAGYGSATHPDQQHIIFDPAQPGIVYLANDGGIWGSRDSGATWPLDLNGGLVTAELFHVGVSGGSVIADMYHEGLVCKADLESSSWRVCEGGSWEFADVHGDPKRPGRFFVFGKKLGLRTLIGNSFVEIGSFNTNIGDFTPKSIAFDLRSNSNTIVVGTDDGRVMRALNGDSAAPTWTVEAGVPPQVRRGELHPLVNNPITGVKFVPDGAKSQFRFKSAWRIGIWAVSSSGQLFSKGDINDNSAWLLRGASPPGSEVIDLAVSSEQNERLYLLRDGGVEMTPNGGYTWTTINGVGTDALPGIGLRSIFAFADYGSVLIVTAVGGIYISLDEGQHWRRFDDDLPNAEIRHAFILGTTLYACTVGRGLWHRDLRFWRSWLTPFRQAFLTEGPHISATK